MNRGLPRGTLARYAQATRLLTILLVLGSFLNLSFARSDTPKLTPLPERVVTIGPNAAEVICALGACGAIVGVDAYTVYPPELGERPRVGGLFDPNLEKITLLRPDLIVLRGRSETLEQLCAKLDVAVYHDPTESLADIPVCIRELGAVLDREAQAERLVSAFHNRIRAVRERAAGREKPRVMLTVARRPDRMADILTAGKGVFLTDMLEIAGGVNIFADIDMGYPQVSLESIVTRQPDVIIELMPEVDLSPALRERILSDWERLGPIPAVQNGRVHILTDDHCLIPSPRYVEIIEKVARLIHPDIEVGNRSDSAAELERR